MPSNFLMMLTGGPLETHVIPENFFKTVVFICFRGRERGFKGNLTLTRPVKRPDFDYSAR
jgi:hypothetical protein